MEVIVMDINEQIDLQDEVTEEVVLEESNSEITILDPEKTFCEQTTYLEFLLSNAKDDEEAEHIKATINDYLDLYNDKVEDDDEEITDEE